MSSQHKSAADAAVVCLRVLNRLLQDEEVTLAQLSYVMENVHDPLAEMCVPPSQRPIPVAASQSSSTSTSALIRFSTPNKYAPAPGAAQMPSVSAIDQKVRRLPPQPAVVSRGEPAQQQQQQRATPAYANKPNVMARKRNEKTFKGGTEITRVPSLPSSTAVRAPLTFSQYWDIFANLPTLYMLHLTLVQQLGAIVRRLTHIVEQSPPVTRDAAKTVALHDGSVCSALMDDTPVTVFSSPSATAPNQNHSQRKHTSVLRHSSASTLVGLRSVYNEIGVVICEFFGSELMKNFMAEHMMYAVKYTQRTAPQLLRLSRLWRWSAESAATAAPHGTASMTASLARLTERDRNTVLENALFLDFLWRSFGPSGVPADDRVSVPAPLEPNQATTAGGGGQGQVLLPMKAPPPAGSSGGGGGGARRSHPSLAASTSLKAYLPPIPALWEGFRTFLVLLATPLNILRRYSHVARCLLESGALPQKDCVRLQSTFVDVAALRMAEETNLVMEKLCLHDVRAIMALMDMPDSSSPVSPCSTANSKATVDTSTGVPISSNPSGGLVSAVALADYSTRALIHYGRLLKRFGRGRHERLAFLFSDWMCYVEEKSNGRFRVRGTIPLSGLHITEVHEAPSLDTSNCFEFVLESLAKRITFYAASPEQRDQWVDAIRYTVRRFCEQQKHEQALKNSSARQTIMDTLTTDDGMPSGIRPTAPMLMSNSRLSRQRRQDSMWQEYVDHQQHVAGMALQPSGTSHGESGVSSPPMTARSAARASSLPIDHSPSTVNTSSGDPSHDGSLASRLSSIGHRQLDYDVKPWSQRASVHRRIRSQELIAVHQQQLAVSTSYNIPTPTQTPRIPASGSGVAIDSDPEQDCIVDPFPEAHNMDNTTSVPLADGNGPSQQQRHSHPLLCLSTSPAAITASTARLSRASTPLRRPVSERFDAVEISSSDEQISQHQNQKEAPLLPSEPVMQHANGGEGEDVPSLPREVHRGDREMVLEEFTEASDPIEDDDHQTSLAFPHAAGRHTTVATPLTVCGESPESKTQRKKGGNSNSGPGKRDVPDNPNGPGEFPTSPTHRPQGPSTPLSHASGDQHSYSTSQGVPNSSVLSSTDVLLPPPDIAHKENRSCVTRLVTMANHSGNKTSRILSTLIDPVHDADGGLGGNADDLMDIAPTTAPHPPGLIAPILPTEMMVSSPMTVAQESASAPVFLGAVVDSPAETDAPLQALEKEAGGEHQEKEVTSLHHADPPPRSSADRKTPSWQQQ